MFDLFKRKKEYKFYPNICGCSDRNGIDLFIENLPKLEKLHGKKIRFEYIKHWEDYCKYIVYTLEEVK